MEYNYNTVITLYNYTIIYIIQLFNHLHYTIIHSFTLYNYTLIYIIQLYTHTINFELCAISLKTSSLDLSRIR